jgi:hypothetical protein
MSMSGSSSIRRRREGKRRVVPHVGHHGHVRLRRRGQGLGILEERHGPGLINDQRRLGRAEAPWA